MNEDRQIREELAFAGEITIGFAISLANELKQIGFTDQKIEEIILKCTKNIRRNKANIILISDYTHNSENTKKTQSTSWFTKIKRAVFQFASSAAKEHGPMFLEVLSEALMKVLEDLEHESNRKRRRK